MQRGCSVADYENNCHASCGIFVKGGRILGRKDIHTNSYFDDNKRFADLVNGTLHNGMQKVKADELRDVSKEFLCTNELQGKKIVSDNAKLWKKNNIVYALYSVENLTYVDYAVVIRCMQTESMGYHKQWKEHKREHVRKKDTSSDAFLSGIGKNDKFYPIVPIVVYYGMEHEWDASITLHDFLGDGLTDDEKEYVNNYKINLFDYHKYDSFEQFNTEVKSVFECLRYSNDADKFEKLLKENEERYRHLDAETGTLIRVLTKNKGLDEYQEKMEGREMDMCKAFEDYRMKGRQEGKLESLRNLMDTLHLSLDQAMEALKIPEQEQEQYRKAI